MNERNFAPKHRDESLCIFDSSLINTLTVIPSKAAGLAKEVVHIQYSLPSLVVSLPRHPERSRGISPIRHV